MTRRGHSLESIVGAGLAPSVRFLQDGIRAKRIPAHKLGRHWVMTEEDIDAYLEARASTPPREEQPRLSLTPTSARRRAS